jgi:hypothetical protein
MIETVMWAPINAFSGKFNSERFPNRNADAVGEAAGFVPGVSEVGKD